MYRSIIKLNLVLKRLIHPKRTRACLFESVHVYKVCTLSQTRVCMPMRNNATLRCLPSIVERNIDATKTVLASLYMYGYWR